MPLCATGIWRIDLLKASRNNVSYFKPNLFIIGASKCATSSLHNWLGAHFQICMSRVKEPGYFLARENRHGCLRNAKSTEEDELSNYVGLFDSVTSGTKYCGESSTAYTHLPHRAGVAERLHEFNPDARLIYIVRDPIVRTISHYWWNVQHEFERRDMLSAIRDDARYRSVSSYAMQLREWLRYFDPERICVVSLEELSNDSTAVFADLLRWLGVDEREAERCILAPENQTPSSVTFSRMRMLHQLRHSAAWDRVGPWIPKWVRRWGAAASVRRVDRGEIDVEPVESFLRPFQQRETEELSELLNRAFPLWTTLWSKDESARLEVCATEPRS